MTKGGRRAATAAFGALACLLAVTACSGEAETAAADAEAAPQGTLSVAVQEPQSPLTPATAADPGAIQVVDALWTGLVRADPQTGQPVLAHATELTTSDNVTWTVRLKPGWTFSDGSPVTADSYVAGWNWAAQCQHREESASEALFGPAAADIKGFDETAGTVGTSGRINCPEQPKPLSGLKVVDDTTFTITLAHPVAVLPSILAHPAFAPVPEAFVADPEVFEANPVGNGPFTLAQRTTGQGYRLSASPGYVGDDAARVAEVEGRVYADVGAAYEDLRAGRLDLLPQLPADALAEDWRDALGEDHSAQESDGTFTTLTIPEGNQQFASRDVRLALSRAVDRLGIALTDLQGTVLPADAWSPPRVAGYAPGTCGTACQYDLFEAKELLAAGGGLAAGISVAYAEDTGAGAAVTSVCDSISATLAIPCLPQPFTTQQDLAAALETGAVLGLILTTWQLDYPSVQAALGPVYSSTGANPGGYDNPAFDAFLTTAATLPQAEADAVYAQAQGVLSRTLPAIPLWSGTAQLGWTARVQATLPLTTPTGTLDLSRLAVVE